ncbi:MAG: ATP phosphoribosyltransferase [Clostridia bacterium]|nr:ATP phosphoribosyltransferase [Clostridia bacterium]
MRYLTVALAKGRLAELSVEIFLALGYDCSQILEKTRKLIFTDEEHKVRFLLVKAGDVPTYVEYGAADLGIVGRDTLLEDGRNVYEMLDLKFGACKMCVCGPPDMKEKLHSTSHLRVASKYPNIAREHFLREMASDVEIIKLSGSVELAPLTGLSEVIVDIVESGKTLRENGLEVLEEICPLSARLIVNRVSAKMERERIRGIVTAIRKQVGNE